MQGVPRARDIPGCETRLRLRGLEALPNVCVLVLSPELERFVARISSCPVFVARFGDMATNFHPCAWYKRDTIQIMRMCVTPTRHLIFQLLTIKRSIGLRSLLYLRCVVELLPSFQKMNACICAGHNAGVPTDD